MATHHHFDPADDARRLKKATKGIGTDEGAIIEILGNRSKEQIAEINRAYTHEFSTTLRKDLEDDTSGHFRDALIGVVTPPAEYKAHYLHQAMSGAGTNEDALIDVLTQVSNKELQDIRYYYELHYGEGKDGKVTGFEKLAKPAGHSKLEKDIESETSYNFKKVLLHLAAAHRQEFRPGEGIDHHLVEGDAQALYKAGEAKWGTDDSTFIDILTARSPWHVQEVDRVYTQKHGHGLAQAIRNETSGDYMKTLLALVKTPDRYWADRIHDAVAGAGTNDRLLIFIVTSFDKPTLQWIGKKYEELHKETLEKAVKGDTSGDYGKLLRELVK